MFAIPMLLCMAVSAPAQRLAPRGATLVSLRAAASPRDTLAEDPGHSQTYYVLHDAGLGGGIGLLVGVATATVLTSASNVTDHSEDPLAYALLGMMGALLGVLTGAVVGSLTH